MSVVKTIISRPKNDHNYLYIPRSWCMHVSQKYLSQTDMQQSEDRKHPRRQIMSEKIHPGRWTGGANPVVFSRDGIKKTLVWGWELCFWMHNVNMCLCVCVYIYVCILTLYVCAVSSFLVLAEATHVRLCVFGVSGPWRFKPFPFIPSGRRDLRPHTHTDRVHRVCVQTAGLGVIYSSSEFKGPAEQWGTIRSLQRGSGPFAAGLTDTDGGAHAQLLFLLMSFLWVYLLLLRLSLSALTFYSLPKKGLKKGNRLHQS